MWEVGLWEDGLTVVGSELFYNYQVYNQAIVVPETIDAKPRADRRRNGWRDLHCQDGCCAWLGARVSDPPTRARVTAIEQGKR